MSLRCSECYHQFNMAQAGTQVCPCGRATITRMPRDPRVFATSAVALVRLN